MELLQHFVQPLQLILGVILKHDLALLGGAHEGRAHAEGLAAEGLQLGQLGRQHLQGLLRLGQGLGALLEQRGGEGQLVDEFNVRHILIKPSEIRTEGEAAQLAQRLYERVQAGESFATLARSFSEDPGSALNGGSLNWVTADAMVPEFGEVMTSTPIKEVSRPFQSQFGWHILEVLDKRNVDMTEDMRKQQASNMLRNRKFEEELQTWLLEIRDDAYVEIKI